MQRAGASARPRARGRRPPAAPQPGPLEAGLRPGDLSRAPLRPQPRPLMRLRLRRRALVHRRALLAVGRGPLWSSGGRVLRRALEPRLGLGLCLACVLAPAERFVGASASFPARSFHCRGSLSLPGLGKDFSGKIYGDPVKCSLSTIYCTSVQQACWDCDVRPEGLGKHARWGDQRGPRGTVAGAAPLLLRPPSLLRPVPLP